MDDVTVIDWELDDSNVIPSDIICLYTKRAEKGEPESLRILACAYHNGIVVEKDENKALSLLEMAANCGDERAMASLGVEYQRGAILEKNLERGFQILVQASTSGYSSIIARLGLCYELGLGTPIDLKKAMSLYDEADKDGNPFAKYRLALIYANGKGGIEQDLLKAFSYAFFASKMGYPPAFELVGKFYMRGDLVTRNTQKGMECFELGMRLGHMPSKYNYAVELIKGENIGQDVYKGISLLLELAEDDYTAAIWALGITYVSGKHIQADEEKALKYFEICTEKDYSPAYVSLGRFHMNKRNFSEAFRCFKKAASLKNSYGYYFMGKMYMNKRLSIFNEDMALKCFKSASYIGNKLAAEIIKKNFNSIL